MRAFFALKIHPDARRTAARVAEEIRVRTHMRASWVPAENYHMTVRFLGEIEADLTVELARVARHAVAGIAPFDIDLDRVGAFPHPERARVLWLGGAPPRALQRLTAEVNAGLEDLGFPRETRAATAHVTLARVKGAPDPALGQVLALLNPVPTQRESVGEMVLMESRLASDGARYSPLFSVPLGGG